MNLVPVNNSRITTISEISVHRPELLEVTVSPFTNRAHIELHRGLRRKNQATNIDFDIGYSEEDDLYYFLNPMPYADFDIHAIIFDERIRELVRTHSDFEKCIKKYKKITVYNVKSLIERPYYAENDSCTVFILEDGPDYDGYLTKYKVDNKIMITNVHFDYAFDRKEIIDALNNGQKFLFHAEYYGDKVVIIDCITGIQIGICKQDIIISDKLLYTINDSARSNMQVRFTDDKIIHEIISNWLEIEKTFKIKI